MIWGTGGEDPSQLWICNQEVSHLSHTQIGWGKSAFFLNSPKIGVFFFKQPENRTVRNLYIIKVDSTPPVHFWKYTLVCQPNYMVDAPCICMAEPEAFQDELIGHIKYMGTPPGAFE